MAARSELSHRLREFKLALMGRMVPRVLSRKTDGVDGFVKKLAAKSSPAGADESTDPELLHPADVPEIVASRSAETANAVEAVDRE